MWLCAGKALCSMVHVVCQCTTWHDLQHDGAMIDATAWCMFATMQQVIDRMVRVMDFEGCMCHRVVAYVGGLRCRVALDVALLPAWCRLHA